MPTTTLRKVGGSVMLAIPPALLDLLNLRAGAEVAVVVADGKLVIEPAPKKRYALADLLAECDSGAEVSVEDHEWLDGRPQGSELL
ncbi:MAG TPA: antitoxin [Rhodoblastus sp.]|nr:antitoxin [Rhodoblastus sp.]